MLPLIALGAFIGVALLKNLNEKLFRKVIIIMAAISATGLLM
jgi:uncharacterized membrane protein YfcA